MNKEEPRLGTVLLYCFSAAALGAFIESMNASETGSNGAFAIIFAIIFVVTAVTVFVYRLGVEDGKSDK